MSDDLQPAHVIDGDGDIWVEQPEGVFVLTMGDPEAVGMEDDLDAIIEQYGLAKDESEIATTADRLTEVLTLALRRHCKPPTRVETDFVRDVLYTLGRDARG